MDDLTTRFTYHAPRDAMEKDFYEQFRFDVKVLAERLTSAVPLDSRERSLALTHLEEAVMWANAAVARHGAVQKYVREP